MLQASLRLTALLLIAGCAQPPDRVVSVAELDPASGNLVALRMHYDDHVDVILCQHPWAVWVEWTDSGRVFRLYDRARQTVTETSEFQTFLSCLEALPKDIQVERLDTCSVPLAYAMPEDAQQRLDQVMKSGGRTWSVDELSEEERRILCTCECLRLEFAHK